MTALLLLHGGRCAGAGTRAVVGPAGVPRSWRWSRRRASAGCSPSWPRSPGAARSARRPLDPDAAPRHRAAARRPRAHLRAAGHRRRRARARLLRAVLRARGRRDGPVRRQPHRLRRLDARPRPGRRPAAALRLLGTHHRLLVPAHRWRGHAAGGPARGQPGADPHHRRRPGDAGRPAADRRGQRQLPALGGGRPPRQRHRDGGGHGARARRRDHQVGDGARSTSGCRPRWRRPPRSAPTCTRPRW